MTDSITLKDDFIFLISNLAGDVVDGPEGYGMYFSDTRYLSRLELRVKDATPELLSHTTDYNIAATFHFSSYKAEIRHEEEGTFTTSLPTVGITRRRYIKQGLVESIEFTNYHSVAVEVAYSLALGTDFADIFQVRDSPYRREGITRSIEISSDGTSVRSSATFSSESREDRYRTVLFECDKEPQSWEETANKSRLLGVPLPEAVLYYNLRLEPRQSSTMHLRITPEPDTLTGANRVYVSNTETRATFRAEVAAARRVFTGWQESCTGIQTDSYVLNRTIETGALDLRSLMQQEQQGLVVTAGIPWYFTLFGRDSLITGIETLSLNPQIAIDTLRALAAYQATELDDWRDSEPGKILHEFRRGDMSIDAVVPHSPYYGSIDSTPLFILLFAETLKWTGNVAFFRELWPNVKRALQWTWKYGDSDNDGYIELKRRSPRGILHQGWKDSDESMGGILGPRPTQPVALIEVQGYYYAALLGLAETLRNYGDRNQQELASRLDAQAAQLKAQFNRDFWWEGESFFAQALDAEKRPVLSVTSNVGHCLWNGIIDEDKAAQVVGRLMRPDMLSGWGIRTMSADDPNYNPMSYHNGSIWPHDNAIIVAGLRHYGFLDEMIRLSGEILDAAATFANYRLPELYCGFARGVGPEREGAPAAYPVSCSPQAWAAGTPAFIMESLLGIEVDVQARSVSLSPVLPESVSTANLQGMRVGNSRFDVMLKRDSQDGSITISQMQAAEGELIQ